MADRTHKTVKKLHLWKVGNEFARYHPSASHCDPQYRDGWNACYDLAQTELSTVRAEIESVKRNARRYLWWRANRLDDTDEACDIINALEYDDGPSLDAAIDARIALEPDEIDDAFKMQIADLLADLEILNFMEVGAARSNREKEYQRLRAFLISLAPDVTKEEE